MPEFQGAIFKASYERRYKVPARGGGFVEAVHIIPPEITGLPVLLAPGWANGIELSKVVLEELYKLGRPTVMVDHARFGIQTSDESAVPKPAQRKSASLIAALDYFQANQVDVIAHSEGGINSAYAALQHPGRIRDMVLIGSAGLMRDDDLIGLGQRFILKEGTALLFGDSERTQERPPSKVKLMLNIGKYVLSNPRWSIEENLAIAQQRSIDLLKQLQDQGIGISFIHNVDDRVFPFKSLDVAGLWNIVGGDKLGGFYSVPGNHNAILGDPRIARMAVAALDSLEYKRKKQSQ